MFCLCDKLEAPCKNPVPFRLKKAITYSVTVAKKYHLLLHYLHYVFKFNMHLEAVEPQWSEQTQFIILLMKETTSLVYV